MDKNESFVYNEMDYKTPKQSPQSNQTWPMDKIRQSRFDKSNNISNARSFLLKCLRDAKSDPLPRRRIPVTYSDEGFLMDGVLVTSATKKKVSDSPSSSLSSSSIFRSQHKKNAEFNSPKSESGLNQETIRSHEQSSDGEGNMLISTPKATNPSKLQASAEPFILTPRQASAEPFNHTPRRASPILFQQHSYRHYNPRFPWPPYPYFQRPRSPFYPYQRPLHFPLLPYQLNSQRHFPLLSGNQASTRRNNNNSSTTPSPSQPNTTTSEPLVHNLTSTIPTDNLSTSTPTTTHGPSPSVNGSDAGTQIPDLSPSPSNELQTVTQNPDLSSPSVGPGTMTTNREWSPSDDGIPTYTEARIDDMLSDNKVLPDSFFGYKYTKRLSAFEEDYSPFYEDYM